MLRSTAVDSYYENSELYPLVLPIAESAPWIRMSSSCTGQFHTQLSMIHLMVIMRLKLPGKEKDIWDDRLVRIGKTE